MAEDCLFCKIAAHEVSADIVAENKYAVAFRDISPQAPTHVLVIPRLHEPNAVALAKVDNGHMDEVVKLAGAVAEQEGLDNGYRMVFNTGADAQQSVFHAHLHLLGGRPFNWPPG